MDREEDDDVMLLQHIRESFNGFICAMLEALRSAFVARCCIYDDGDDV